MGEFALIVNCSALICRKTKYFKWKYQQIFRMKWYFSTLYILKMIKFSFSKVIKFQINTKRFSIESFENFWIFIKFYFSYDQIICIIQLIEKIYITYYTQGQYVSLVSISRNRKQASSHPLTNVPLPSIFSKERTFRKTTVQKQFSSGKLFKNIFIYSHEDSSNYIQN